MCIQRVGLASVALGQVTKANPPELETFHLDGRKVRYLDVGK